MEIHVPENILQNQRIEMYLHDLIDRLKELRQQHEEVFQNSVEIINEIDEVSLTLCLAQDNSSVNQGRIKRIIKKFETNKEKTCKKELMDGGNQIDKQQVLQIFEKLNDSHLLTESLQLFRKAKDSFQKLDVFFETSGILGSGGGGGEQTKHYKKLCISDSIRNKIDKFNQKQFDSVPTTSKNINTANTDVKEIKQQVEKMDENNEMVDSPSHYTSCCSSLVSIERLNLKEDTSKMDISKCSNSLTGYEGDNEYSEYDMITAKTKLFQS